MEAIAGVKCSGSSRSLTPQRSTEILLCGRASWLCLAFGFDVLAKAALPWTVAAVAVS